MGQDATEPWTVLRMLDWTREYFARAGLDEPRLCAEVLLAHVLDCSRIEMYARFDRLPGEAQRADFRDLVKRAVAREPVAYLVGSKEFYSMAFQVTPDVLVPRSETEILVTEAIGLLKALGRAGSLWDVCTGCGCIASAVAAQVPDVTVLATDISAQAVRVAAGNVAAHHLDDRVTCLVADLLSLPKDWAGDRDFDVVTANPPYIAEGDPVGEAVRHEPPVALYAAEGGLEFLGRLIADAPALLRSGGALILEFGHRHADAVRELIHDSGAYAEPKILRDHQEIERAAVALKR